MHKRLLGTVTCRTSIPFLTLHVTSITDFATCNNEDMLLEWKGGLHSTAHALFGQISNIDPAMYKVRVKVNGAEHLCIPAEHL